MNQMKLGCKPEYDARSRNFSVDKLTTGKKPRSYTWRLNTILDQGSQGSCVGHGWAHELLARPAEAKGINHDKAISIYYNAQRLDRWEGGEYPGASSRNEGTSVLAGAKATMITGLIGGYYWAFTFSDFILALSRRGPAVVGTDWRHNMSYPDASGVIHATGAVEGGHCYLVYGINTRTEMLLIANSWGTGWADNGRATISFADMQMLLADGGVACFADRRRVK